MPGEDSEAGSTNDRLLQSAENYEMLVGKLAKMEAMLSDKDKEFKDMLAEKDARISKLTDQLIAE